MNAETMFWIGTILLSPALFKLSWLATRMLLDVFIPDDRVVVRYFNSKGKMVRKTIHLENNDEVIKVLDEVKTQPSRRRGYCQL